MKKGLIAVLSIMLTVAVFLVVRLYLSVSSNIIQESVQGIITQIDESKIILDNQTAFIIGNSADFFVSDQIRIDYSYIEERKEESIKIDKVTLLNRSQEDIKIYQVLSTMTLEEKAAQMFFVRCPADNPLEELEKYQMGGYILFDANIKPFSKQQFIENNHSFQKASETGLFIGIDEEGGSVVRLSRYALYRSFPFQSPQMLFQEGGWDAVELDTYEKSRFLKNLGINLNFAPVADFSTEPTDFIYNRVFGENVQMTADYIQKVVSIMKESRIGSVLKHFPGYGDNSDTHSGSAVDRRAYFQFTEIDFLPFIKGIQADADCVLISHNIVVSMDEQYPASLSVRVHEILRNDLNFKGVIITDDLIMDAIDQVYGAEQAAVLAVKAGNDMIISGDYKVQIQSIIDAVKDGRILETRIDESVIRILRLKYRLNILK